MSSKDAKHVAAMKKQKESVDNSIRKAAIEKGICVLLTGNGKGKTSSAFGMIMRALGYGQKVGIVQFIKGTQKSGEELYIQNLIDSGSNSSLFFPSDGYRFYLGNAEPGHRHQGGQSHVGNRQGPVER